MAKTQWNTMNAETKEIITTFATTYAKRVAQRDSYRKSVKAYEEVIATDEDELRRLALGKSEGIVRTLEEIGQSLATNRANIKPKREAWEKADKECAEIMANVKDIVPKSLYEYYTKREVMPTEYTKALTNWAKDMGVTLTESTNRVLRETMGDKESDRAMLKDNTTLGLTAMKYDVFARILVKKVAKLMGVMVAEDENK